MRCKYAIFPLLKCPTTPFLTFFPQNSVPSPCVSLCPSPTPLWCICIHHCPLFPMASCKRSWFLILFSLDSTHVAYTTSHPLPFPQFFIENPRNPVWTLHNLLHSWVWVDGRSWAAPAAPNLEAGGGRERLAIPICVKGSRFFSPSSQMCREDVASLFL